LSTPSIQPAWKKEVNQRLAAHKSRKGTVGAADPKPQALQPCASRAAEAAARVAARYAKAPSYTQMQAEEARVAVRAAEIATQVAIQAQAAAESALAGLHAASVEQPMRGPAVIENIKRPAQLDVEQQAREHELGQVEDPATKASNPCIAETEPAVSASVARPGAHSVMRHEASGGTSFNLRWEPDLPARAMPKPAPVHVQEQFELATEDWWTPARVSATLHCEPIEVDADQSHANLIQFPREVVATRKMRPRLAETVAGVAVEGEAQLSIFEVDPGTISTEPMAETLPETSAAAWSGPVWSGMELDAHPAREEIQRTEASSEKGPFLAPLGLRLMAIAVDAALVLATFFAAAMWIESKMASLPGPKVAEFLVVVGLVLAGFAYHALFFTLVGTTPGIHYAGIGLCTFDDGVPNREQLRRRLCAMVVSLLPVGLGMVWSVFDEDHLSWHDRLSETYLRKR
jgi:uncharacterized RDD family membrane protein YckC